MIYKLPKDYWWPLWFVPPQISSLIGNTSTQERKLGQSNYIMGSLSLIRDVRISFCVLSGCYAMVVYIFMIFLEEEKLFFQRLDFTLHIQASNIGVINDLPQTCNISFHGLSDGHLILKPITHRHTHIMTFQVMHYNVSVCMSTVLYHICQADDFCFVYSVILKITTFSEACQFDPESLDAFLRCLWCWCSNGNWLDSEVIYSQTSVVYLQNKTSIVHSGIKHLQAKEST